MATHGLLSADAPRLIEESAIDEVRTLKQKLPKTWFTDILTLPTLVNVKKEATSAGRTSFLSLALIYSL